MKNVEDKWKSKPLCGEEIFEIKKMLWYIAVTPKILDFNMTRYVDGPHRNFLITTKIYAKEIEFLISALLNTAHLKVPLL